MPQFCDVALPVPLETTFTYRVDGDLPVVGGRVLVPFRDQRLLGVVVALHQRPPAMLARLVLRVLDRTPLIDEDLLKLARWLAQYYIAPLGEVLRTMLPLTAEWKRARGYRITEAGLKAWQAAERAGQSRRLPLAPAQTDEYEVLHYLAQHAEEAVREATLRSASGAAKDLLQSLVRRKWIAREDLSETRDAKRTVQIAVLKSVAPACKPGSPAGPVSACWGGRPGSPASPVLACEGGRPAVLTASTLTDPGAGEDAPATAGLSPQQAQIRLAGDPGLEASATPCSEGKSGRALNANQQLVLDTLAAAGGRFAVDCLRDLAVPKSTLQTLVKRGLVE